MNIINQPTTKKSKKSQPVKQYNKRSFTGFSDDLFCGSIAESLNGHRFSIDSLSHQIVSY